MEELATPAAQRRFEDRVVLVTGGAGGIGAATARRMAGEGARVALADLAGSAGEALARQIGAQFFALDVTDESQWQRTVGALLERHGRLDVLVNAAGIEGDVRAGTLEGTSLAEWRRVMAVNLDGTFLGCRAVLPAMRAAGRGAIVNLASVAAYYPTPQSIAYGASKGGVTQLTKSVALAAAQDNQRIRCNSVHPGMIASPMLERINAQLGQRDAPAAAEAVQAAMRRMPLGAPGTPEQAAAVVAFLASDEAAYITGAEFTVDGGWRLLR